MQRIDPLQAAWPLHDTSAGRHIEQAAAAGLPPNTLMRRAGLSVARLAMAIAPHARTVWVAAGPGNNGGDGLEAALHLSRMGRRVHVGLLADASRLPADAKLALERARAAGVSITDAIGAGDGSEDLLVDALLGLGSSRAPAGAIAEAVRRLNAEQRPVLAVDLPTGLDGQTGATLGDDAVRATHTLSLLTLKPGLFTGDGRDLSGRVWLDTLGVGDNAHSATATLAGGPDLAHAASRLHGENKGSFGDVFVVGGAPMMIGAALLAGRAAHAAGAGRVHIDLLDDHAVGYDVVRPELMFRPGWWRGDAKSLSRATVACGCGGGSAVVAALPPLLEHAKRLVVDADALNAIAGDRALQDLLVARGARTQPTVLTPHPLEAARLLGVDTARVQADRLAAAQTLADRYACVALLKGSGSVIAAPGERPTINPTGNAALATAGTGDVLAGWIAGLWAQAADDALPTALRIAIAAAFRHGLAAGSMDESASRPLRAADLIERMYALD